MTETGGSCFVRKGVRRCRLSDLAFQAPGWLSSPGYPFRGRFVVPVFDVLIVWAVFLAVRGCLIGRLAISCFLLAFMQPFS